LSEPKVVPASSVTVQGAVMIVENIAISPTPPGE
jgi:hypothetical protein